MEFIEAKTILAKAKMPEEWFGIDYNMNLYRGCPHGCIYCDSRSSCYGIEDFDRVRGKKDALLILEDELKRKRSKGVVSIGSMSDAYNPLEKRYEQTRSALKLLYRYGFGVSIDTKSDLILKDIDILAKIAANADTIIKVTITTPHDELSRIIEPHVCPSSRRFETIRKLSENGIFTGVLMMPILPYISDKEEDIRELVKMAHESGARFIYPMMGVTLRDNQREYYYRKLDELFPGLKERYAAAYGDAYYCPVRDSRKLYQTFIKECDRYGLLFEMRDIVAAYRKKKDEMISLF